MLNLLDKNASIRLVPALSGEVINLDSEAPDESVSAGCEANPGMQIEALKQRYDRRLSLFLYRLTRDRELSEDLLQETWLRVLSRGHQFRGNSKLSTWLFAIARNLVFDLKRKGSIVVRDLGPFEDTGDPYEHIESRDRNPHEHFEQHETSLRLKAAMVALSPKQKLVLELRYFQGFSVIEISRHIGASVPCVKSILHRSNIILRTQLGGMAA